MMRSGAVGESLDLDALAAQLNTEQGVDQEYLRSTGMPQELAAKTGLDTNTAIKALQQVLAMLMGQKKETAKNPAKKKPKSTGKTAKESAAKKPKSTAKKPKSTAKKPKSTAKTSKSGKKTSPRRKTSSRAEGIDVEEASS